MYQVGFRITAIQELLRLFNVYQVGFRITTIQELLSTEAVQCVSGRF